MSRSRIRHTVLQEATAKLERAQARVTDLQAQLTEAIADVKAAKTETNEALLGGLIDPVVEYLIGNQHYDALEALRAVCTTTNGAVCRATQRLVYKSNSEVATLGPCSLMLQLIYLWICCMCVSVWMGGCEEVGWGGGFLCDHVSLSV